ncbi:MULTISPECIES: metal ABC transporter ATP-binding protein [Terrabacteria group]|uniref:metal ABC transporter ATP-binding protein n=1 Tax=Bacillati TaxID=1783272 RepID=UPI00193AAEF1|nr:MULTISPECIES: ABC transporter ATP-binding protein [Terrabacteria group]MBW9212999.1 ABC transporter ATP-binding protein [Trueperella sp. zg.1013]QRG87041.1 ABC transporter ATP-binding protein [Bulleidia sp. zg-1006]
MEQLLVKELSTGYENHVLHSHINFSVHQGDYLCVIGENGSGKSTLLKTILGLIPNLSGTVQFNPKVSIAYLPQQRNIQADFPASVKEVVLSGFIAQLKWRPFYNKKEKEKAAFFMKKMGVYDLADKAFTTLSGGQQQRVLLARALCASQEFLFLDEPVASLDEQAAKEFYALIDHLNEKENMTIVMITHDRSYALKRASHILSLEKGFFFGTKEEYLGGQV